MRILNELRACLLEVPILKEVSGLPRIDGVSAAGSTSENIFGRAEICRYAISELLFGRARRAGLTQGAKLSAKLGVGNRGERR